MNVIKCGYCYSLFTRIKTQLYSFNLATLNYFYSRRLSVDLHIQNREFQDLLFLNQTIEIRFKLGESTVVDSFERNTLTMPA